jgi:alkylation response protein AidB-like acyl-CoA dehydrogenase
LHRQLTDEQRLIAEAADNALQRHNTLAQARAALDDPPAADLWTLAVDAGWAGMMSSTPVGGTGLGALEAMLVLEVCGRRLADARLLGHLPAVAVLEAAGAPDELRVAAAGGARMAIVDAELGRAKMPVVMCRSAEGVVGHGRVECVLDAPGATTLVVRGVDAAKGPSFAFVAATAPGVEVTAEATYDPTREVGTVSLAGAEMTVLDLEPALASVGRDLQRALIAAESVGAADACLLMARTYAAERVAFGRAIGSYQAIKHKLVEMLRRIEGARSVADAAGRDWPGSEFLVSANAAFVTATDALTYTAPENIFIHGAVGATWEHDAPLYYRRGEMSRRLGGGVENAAVVVAGAVRARRQSSLASVA